MVFAFSLSNALRNCFFDIDNRRRVAEHHTVIIHDTPDGFTTQPSGNAGNKIACGEIVGVRR
ncbi:MAG: superoxide dismutase family protein [Clostridia bacterium]|nr:superoxide dismutase family protein [Clostridia bacterium]